MKYVATQLHRMMARLTAGVLAVAALMKAHPVGAAALELFPSSFDQKISLVANDPAVIVARIINAALLLIGVVMVALILYAGFTYMTAAGEEEKITRAKKVLTSAVIGLAIILSSMAITRFVLNALLGNVTTGDACTTAGVTESCSVGYCAGTRTCSSGGFYGACLKLDPSCQSGTETLPRGTFGVLSMSPSGTINSKKIVVKVVLSGIPKSDTVPGSIVVKNKATGVVVPGTVHQGAITFARGTAFEKVLPLASDTIAFVPQAFCTGFESRDLHCFDPSTAYEIQVSPTLARASDGASMYCGLGGDKCRGSFTSGTQVDITPPTVTLRVDPSGSITTTECATVQADVRDDGGIAEVEFWHTATIGRNVSTDKFGVEGGQGTTSRVASVRWCPGATSSINEKHFLYVRAFDNDTGMTETAKTEITLRAGSCTVCGAPGCGACPGGSCAVNADCFDSLTCDSTSRTCQSKPRITLVSPSNGKPGTMVTIWGMYFGTTSGRVEFTGPNGTRLAAEVPNRCGANYQFWSVDATGAGTVTVVVPQGAVDGPVYVTTTAGVTDASNDANGMITPSSAPGPGVPPAGEFDVNDINRPGACSASPTIGVWGTRVSMAVVEAGSTTGATLFNGTPASNISSWSNTSVATSVPHVDYGANQPVTIVAANGNESNAVRFTVNSPDAGTKPEITSIDPSASGGPSSGITVKGKNFGEAPGVVYFAAPDGQVVAADISGLPESCGGAYWKTTEIRVKVPRIVDTDDWNENGNRTEVLESDKYTAYVVRYDDVESNRPSFSMKGRAAARPFIWCISPESGKAFTNITVYGDELGQVPIENRGLMFNTLATNTTTPTRVVATLTNVGGTPGAPCPTNGWNDNTVCAQIPAYAISGKVRIETKCGDVDCVSNEVEFKIGSCSDAQTPIACRANEQCCSDGVCRANGMCQGSVPDGSYRWTFTTASTPVSPRVVEDCAENALDAGVDTATLAGRYASPSPWASRAGGDAACINSAITVRFASPVITSTLSTSRVVLDQCGAGSATAAVRMSFEAGADEPVPQIITPTALSVSTVPMPGVAADGTGVLRLSKTKPSPDRMASRCSTDVTVGCNSAAVCVGAGATCAARKEDANVYVDDFGARIPLPAGSEVRGRTYIATVKVRAPQDAGADDTRRAGILVRKVNSDGTREEVRTISQPLSDIWQEISARLTMGEKNGAVEVRIFLLSPDVSVRNAETDFYTYSALFDAFTIADIAGVDCKERVATLLQPIPSVRGICDGDYKTTCVNKAECTATVGGECVQTTGGFMLTPSTATQAFTGAVCDKGDADKIGKACTNDASCGAGGVCRDGVWYRVALKSGVCSNNAAKACVVNADCGTGANVSCVGITAFDPSGAAMKENPGACGTGNAYCFLFRVVNKTCAVGAVITTPNPWTARSQWEAIAYNAIPVAGNDACINLNPSGMNWSWQSSNTALAAIDADATAGKVGQKCRLASECAIGDCVNGYCTSMPWTATASALDETPVLPKPQPVKISAAVQTTNQSLVKGAADLYIQFVDPIVTEVWPRCAAACLNAEIGAHFNIPMNPSSLTASGNIQLWRVNCGNSRVDKGEDCDDGNTVGGDGCSDRCLNESSLFRFRCGNRQLDNGEECDDGNVSSSDGCSNKCVRESVLAGVWTLEKKDAVTKLVAQSAAETGWTSLATGICGDSTVNTTAVAGGTIGESCDDGNTVGGDGCSALCALEGTSMVGAVCGNAKLERGEECDRGTDGQFASWCNATTCLRTGTAAPVCGNGKIDPGEACEKSQLVGAAQILCTAQCVWTGTNSYNPTGSGSSLRMVGCGDGKVQVGESCDDGNAKGGDGCSAICLNEGSTTTVGPGCGNGRIDKGESCDTNHRATQAGCDPNTCLRRGTAGAVCGNGILETGESCDWQAMVNARPPGTSPELAEAQAKTLCDAIMCTNKGTIAPICGNGRIDVGESCDDNNGANNDGCSSICLNEGTVATVVPITVRVASEEVNNAVVIEPQNHALLAPNSTYRAILMGEKYCIGTNCTPGIQSASQKALTALNFWRSNTEATRLTAPPSTRDERQTPNAYSWTFTTGTEVCTPERVDVVPAESSLYMIGARTQLNVKAKSKPDSCNAEGQTLNAMLYGWTWKSDKPAVADVIAPQDRMPECGNAIVERGEDCDDGNAVLGDGCSVICLNEGSDYVRQCGNNRIDAGESCDDGNTISGDFCSSKCLIEGFVPGSWRLAGISGTCGNGIREYLPNATNGNPGEECDDGNLAKNDGCSPVCIKEGSRAPLCNDDNNRRVDADARTGAGEACDPKAGSVLGCDPNRCIWSGTSSATCGNERIEFGEDCDDGNTKVGDGCSSICLNEGVSVDWAVTRSTDDEIRMIAGATPQTGFSVVLRGVCGNNVIESFAVGATGGSIAEECDDGNTTPGDGCSARCTNEGTARVTITDNPGGDPMQWVEAKGVTVKKYCRNTSEDFPTITSSTAICTTNQECVTRNNNNPSFICDVYNPWETAMIEGKITAAPPRQDKAINKAGSGAVTVYCGAKSDAQCAAQQPGASTSSVGVGTDSCCYERPTPDAALAEPTITQGVCPNGVFVIGFNQVIDEDSLEGNLMIARQVDSETCPTGSVAIGQQETRSVAVSNSSFEIAGTNQNGLGGSWESFEKTGTNMIPAPTAVVWDTDSYTGQHAIRQSHWKTNIPVIARVPVTLEAGIGYRAAVWYKIKRLPNDYGDRTNVAFLRVTKNNALVKQYAVPGVEGETWKNLYVSFTPETRGQYYLELVIEKAGTIILWDDVTLTTEAVVVQNSLVGRIASAVGRWFSRIFDVPVATADAGLWCSTSGIDATVEPRPDGVSSFVRVAPRKVLDVSNYCLNKPSQTCRINTDCGPASDPKAKCSGLAHYKLIARGDSSLGDDTVDGITNYRGVAMNGQIARQWMFTTAEKLCTLDAVRIDLSCVRNGRCQNNLGQVCTADSDCGPASDTTARCEGQDLSGAACAAFRKKGQATTVRASARSNAAGGQAIQPVDGYRWAWGFNTSAVAIVAISKVAENTAAPVQRLGGAAGGRTCTPSQNTTLTCRDGRCGGSSYLPECSSDTDCASLATCRSGRCGGASSMPACNSNTDCDMFAVGVCKSATALVQEATAGTTRGEGYVSAEAKIVEDTLNAGVATNLGQTVTGTERFISMLCENPWPSDMDRRCSSNPNLACTTDIDCINANAGTCGAALPLADSEGRAIGGDRPTNFSLWYCRDGADLLPVPTVGLPVLSTLSVVPSQSSMARTLFRDGTGDVSIAATTSRADILKEIILTYPALDRAKTDTIGVRVVRNDAGLSPMEWYQSQGFTGKPTALTDMVDGYLGIGDGRTVYIAGTNVTTMTTVGTEPRVYSNIYILAYNEGASDTTKAIYRDILKNFRLNVNLSNARVCSGNVNTSCTEDGQCGGAAGTCLSDIDKLHRDIIRASDLSRMTMALEAAKSRNGSYPQLASGSYVRAVSTSRWPSWQSAFGSAIGIAAPDDPLKSGFVNCDTAGGFDRATCFNQQKGEYQCPAGSHVYQYQAIGGQGYKLSANFEYKPGAYSQPYPSLWGLDAVRYDIAHCNASQITNVYSNRLACGDGVVGRDTTRLCPRGTDAECPTGSQCDTEGGYCVEECEPGQVDRRECDPSTQKFCQRNRAIDCTTTASACTQNGIDYGPCVALSGTVTGEQTRVCTSGGTNACRFGGWSSCRVAGFCGDGKVDAGEACDDATLNGTYGKCDATCTATGSFCGDSTVDPGEVCDLGAKNGLYNSNPALSCKDDCSGAFTYCGDRVVQKNANETCDPVGTLITTPGVCNSLVSSTIMQNQACTTDVQCGGKCATPSPGAFTCRSNLNCNQYAPVCIGATATAPGKCAKLTGSCMANSDCASGSTCYVAPTVCELCPTQPGGYIGVRKATCSASCSVAPPWGDCSAQGQCGNGQKDGSEQCDDGNSNNADSCIIDSTSGNRCVLAKCGDGFLMGKVCAGGVPGQERVCTEDSECGTDGRCIVKEECDQGAENGQVCTPRSGSECTYCSTQCKRVTVSGDYCGDGKWNSAVEECDKDLNPAVNAWQGLILKNASAQETGRYLCIGTPGVNQNAWNFADASSWAPINGTKISLRNAVEQTSGNSFVNNVLEVKPITPSLANSDLNPYSVQATAVSGGATPRMFEVSLLARCGRGAGTSCGGIGVDFVKENFTPSVPFKCTSDNCINVPLQDRRVSGSQWAQFTKTLSIPPGIQNYRLRVYFAQPGSMEPVWIDRLAVNPVSTSPAPIPWNTATVKNASNQLVPAVGIGANNVAMCNSQTCGRGCPIGGVVCENVFRACPASMTSEQCRIFRETQDDDTDGVVNNCDTDRDGDGVLDVYDCNPRDKQLHQDAGMIIKYSNYTWNIKIDPTVRTMRFLVANYNINGDPEERPLITAKHDLSKLGEDDWLRAENDRLWRQLLGKNVCVRSSDNTYSTQICSSSSECTKHSGVTETCKPWDDTKWIGMRKPQDAPGFFRLQLHLEGTRIPDATGSLDVLAPAVGLGSPHEVVVPITPSDRERVLRVSWLNDWCDRGVPYGCTAAVDGIGHDLNLVIQRIVVDTEDQAAVCQKIVAPNNDQIWPTGSATAPIIQTSTPYTPSAGSASVPTATQWPETYVGRGCSTYEDCNNPAGTGNSVLWCGATVTGNHCTYCRANPSVCGQIPSVGGQYSCDQGSGLCVFSPS